MELFGYAAAILIGLSLGLIGGGGSILTVPVLVYLMGISAVTATAYSLFIVGTTSLIGGIQKYREGLVNIKAAVSFGIPSILTVFLTRKFLFPAIHNPVFTLGEIVVSKDLFIMLLFSILMLGASYSMIHSSRNDQKQESVQELKFNQVAIILEGIFVGTIAGLVGAGGGFLIIPSLVLFVKLPMKKAIGTSLVIIAAQSLIGFVGDLTVRTMDWELLLIFASLAIIGIFAGNKIGRNIDNRKLKRAFGWFVLCMGIYIILKETIWS